MVQVCPTCSRLIAPGEPCLRCGPAQETPGPTQDANLPPPTSTPTGRLHRPGSTRSEFYLAASDAEDTSCDMDVGTMLDDGWLEVLERIGTGGTASVYRAYDHRLGGEVAVKLLRPELAQRPRALSCLQAEASVLAQLKHPGFVGFYRQIWHDGRFGMVLELLDSGDLADRLPMQGFEPEQAVRWTQQLLEALDALHARGMVHRDLKLENVLLDAQGNARLADLGIRYDMRDETDETNLRGRTGTPRTMSPEQARGGIVDQRSDIYTAGLLLCEMATGRLPFPEPPATGPVVGPLLAPDLDQLREVVGEDVAAVAARALAPAPEHRFQRALAMRVALNAAVGHASKRRRIRLGRDASQVDVLTEGDGVSGVHCELQWQDGYVMVTDLDSTNGTFVNGRALEPYVPLAVSLDAVLLLGRSVSIDLLELQVGYLTGDWS